MGSGKGGAKILKSLNYSKQLYSHIACELGITLKLPL